MENTIFNKFEQLIKIYNPNNNLIFRMPLSELYNYFPLNEKSFTAPYGFGGGIANNNQAKAIANENNWGVKMIYPEDNNFFKQEIEFNKLQLNKY